MLKGAFAAGAFATCTRAARSRHVRARAREKIAVFRGFDRVLFGFPRFISLQAVYHFKAKILVITNPQTI